MHIKTSIEDFLIRKAEKEDISIVFDFIKKLAAYEKLSHEVVATEKNLEKYLFGEEKVAEVGERICRPNNRYRERQF